MQPSLSLLLPFLSFPSLSLHAISCVALDVIRETFPSHPAQPTTPFPFFPSPLVHFIFIFLIVFLSIASTWSISSEATQEPCRVNLRKRENAKRCWVSGKHSMVEMLPLVQPLRTVIDPVLEARPVVPQHLPSHGSRLPRRHLKRWLS